MCVKEFAAACIAMLKVFVSPKSYGQYIPELYICAAVNLEPHRYNAAYQLVFDLTCLTTMLVCLIRMHRGGSLWRFLLQQVGKVHIVPVTFELT
jgi:hypothetical protein